jgi:hypothetical protein
VESNESLDIASRSWVVKFLSLFDTERIKQFFDWMNQQNEHSSYGMNRIGEVFTLFLFSMLLLLRPLYSSRMPNRT